MYAALLCKPDQKNFNQVKEAILAIPTAEIHGEKI